MQDEKQVVLLSYHWKPYQRVENEVIAQIVGEVPQEVGQYFYIQKVWKL